MRRVVTLLALVAVLALAGCSGPVGIDDLGGEVETPSPETETPAPSVETVTKAPTAEATDSETVHSTPTATATATRSPRQTATDAEPTTPTATSAPATATPDDTLSDDNPWGQEVVPVRINDTVDDGRNTTALTVRTIDYWNANIERYTDFEYRFRLAEDPDSARVELRYLAAVDSCNGTHERVAGCAAYLQAGTRADDLEIVRVESRSSNSAVLVTTRHEFGHLVGLGHSDEPLELMAQNYGGDLTNATDRAMPWYDDRLHVAVEPDTIDGDAAVIREQVRHAVSYYDDGAAGTVPRNVTVAISEQPHTAEVIVTNDTARGCGRFDGSRVVVSGSNLDTDPASERYARMIVCVGPVGEDAVGWHVGYWLGTAFGLDDGERAAVFQDASYSERRSEWWE